MKTLALLTVPLFLLTSCGLFNKDKSEEEEPLPKTAAVPEKRVIGRIATVSKAREFVLIQKFGPGALPKNTIYQSQGPGGRTASLRPSGERVRDFYAADLVNGNVEKGDAVIGYPDLPTEPKIKEDTTELTPNDSEIEL